MSFIIKKIIDWRLNLQIPENQEGAKRFRYARDGKTKIPLVDSEEVDNYNKARENQKQMEDNRS